MNYKYIVNIYNKNEGEEITLKTNDVVSALDFLLRTIGTGTQCDLLDGFTGEVLVIANNPDHEDYATPEMSLMMAGMVFNAQHGCKNCAEPEEIEPDDLMTLLEQMVAEGKAVKLGGLPS